MSRPTACSLLLISNIEGLRVEPCGCTPDPLGGIARFAAVYKNIESALSHRIALIDTGDLLFDSSTRNDADLCQDNARIDLLLSTLVDLGLKTVFPGPYDLARGSNYRDHTLEKYALTTLRPIGQIGPEQNIYSYISVISAKDFDVSIIGVKLDDEQLAPRLRTDIAKSIKHIATNKRNKAIIALSQMSPSLNKLVFESMHGIDIVVNSQNHLVYAKHSHETWKRRPDLDRGRQAGSVSYRVYHGKSFKAKQRATGFGCSRI